MGKKEKLIKKLKSLPKDMTFEELQTLLLELGFEVSNKGKTSGSRIMFRRGNLNILIHKPHPKKEMLVFYLREILKKLESEEII